MSTRCLFKPLVILIGVAVLTLSLVGNGQNDDFAQRHMANRGFEGRRGDPCRPGPTKFRYRDSRIPPNQHFRRWISSIARMLIQNRVESGQAS